MGSRIKDNYFRMANALLVGSILLACLSINLPTAWMTLSISMIILSFFLSGKFNLKYHRILQNEGANTAIIFLIFCCIGTLYSSGEFAIKTKFKELFPCFFKMDCKGIEYYFVSKKYLKETLFIQIFLTNNIF